MKKSRLTVIFDRKKKAAKSGKGQVELRIYLNHDERKFISLGEIHFCHVLKVGILDVLHCLEDDVLDDERYNHNDNNFE